MKRAIPREIQKDLRTLARLNLKLDRHFGPGHKGECDQGYCAFKDHLFGNLKQLCKDISTYVHEKNVENGLIARVHAALSWEPLMFSEDEIPKELRRTFLASVRELRRRRLVRRVKNAIGRQSSERPRR